MLDRCAGFAKYLIGTAALELGKRMLNWSGVWWQPAILAWRVDVSVTLSVDTASLAKSQ